MSSWYTIEKIDDIDKALINLFQKGKLKHGEGIFEFDNFAIHVQVSLLADI